MWGSTIWWDKGVGNGQCMAGGPFLVVLSSVTVLFYGIANGYYKGWPGLHTWKLLNLKMIFPISYTHQFLFVVDNYCFIFQHLSLLSSDQLHPLLLQYGARMGVAICLHKPTETGLWVYLSCYASPDHSNSSGGWHVVKVRPNFELFFTKSWEFFLLW